MKLKARLMMPIQKANEEENMGDIAQFESEGFIFVAELKNCQNEQLDPNKEYEVDVMFYGHQLDGIYGTAEEFHKSNAPMAEESYIPMGAFPANPEDKNWKPSPMNLINSKIVDVAPADAPNIPKEILLFVGTVEGHEIEQCFYFQNTEDKPSLKAGQYISGVYWAELYLAEEEVQKQAN